MKKFIKDYKRYTNKSPLLIPLYIIAKKYVRYIFFGRLSQKNIKIIKPICKFMYRRIGYSMGNEIDFYKTKIGEGLLLTHPFGITVDSSSVLGENITIFKGTTIGSIRSGKKMGSPNIGNNVVIGANCMICGKINVGENCLIAANSFVNFDVPDNSMVIGNPGIIHKENKHKGDYKY